MSKFNGRNLKLFILSLQKSWEFWFCPEAAQNGYMENVSPTKSALDCRHQAGFVMSSRVLFHRKYGIDCVLLSEVETKRFLMLRCNHFKIRAKTSFCPQQDPLYLSVPPAACSEVCWYQCSPGHSRMGTLWSLELE